MGRMPQYVSRTAEIDFNLSRMPEHEKSNLIGLFFQKALEVYKNPENQRRFEAWEKEQMAAEEKGRRHKGA